MVCECVAQREGERKNSGKFYIELRKKAEAISFALNWTCHCIELEAYLFALLQLQRWWWCFECKAINFFVKMALCLVFPAGESGNRLHTVSSNWIINYMTMACNKQKRCRQQRWRGDSINEMVWEKNGKTSNGKREPMIAIIRRTDLVYTYIWSY